MDAPGKQTAVAPSLDRHSPPAAKIACFRSLFRGRSDVYPQRFESGRTGRSGYSPACANEWVRGVCEKPRVKCADCPHQSWLPVEDRTVHWHLTGRDPVGKPFVMGVYPMLRDESCHFLAIDLDGEKWREDARVLAEAVARLELPLALERSRSGNGAHCWFFFEAAVPAREARRLGTLVLSEAMEARPEVGMASYDRLFPNQDTLPKGGFGNLIALPLQKAAREAGNSVFLDDALEPHPDQWRFLGGIPRISRACLDAVLARAERGRRVFPVRAAPEEAFALRPWEAPPSRRPPEAPLKEPLPERIEAVHSDRVYLPKAALTPGLRNRILRLAAFANPEFHKAEAMRLPTYGKPRVVACAEDHPEHLALPRGCLGDLRKLLRRHGVGLRLIDKRNRGTGLDVCFRGELRPGQKAAAEALLRHDTGVLAATTAFGKTVLAARMIAGRGVNTLVLVHRKQLMDQWVERLSEFLDLPKKSIGRLGGGRRKLRGRVDVALIQSLVRQQTADDRIAEYGQVIVDECHHLPARSFELAVGRAKAKYLLGLSATVARKDGHEPIVFMQCGPVRHRVDAKEQAAARPFRHRVLVRPTGFRPSGDSGADARLEYQNLCRALAEDAARNRLIRDDVLAALREGRHPLVLTERTDHLAALDRLFAEAGCRTVRLRGGMTRQSVRANLALLEAPEPPPPADAPGCPGTPEGPESPDANCGEPVPPVVLATGRFVGEGFDCPRLDTLFLAMPVSWRGTVAQYVGRLHRLHEAKEEVRVYDYADLEAAMLARMFDKRCAAYESVGYTLLMPASALPGWPAEVPLPLDAQWKRDYAASVKRLVRDGVDRPLAEDFVVAARPPADTPAARSATEAFLHRRLRSLSATRDVFRLNGRLPIPFEADGTMEIDFLFPGARLAVELDGPHHLADAEAYRRDRRKDALLQRHGYFVLRFLAGDVTLNLDRVLDAILECLDHRNEAAR